MLKKLDRMPGQIPHTDREHQTLISRTMPSGYRGNPWTHLVLLIVLLAVGWLWMRRRKKAT